VNVRHGHTTVGDVRALITAAKESGYRGIALNTTVSVQIYFSLQQRICFLLGSKPNFPLNLLQIFNHSF